MLLNELGSVQSFRQEQVLLFNSTRKRMSVIVQDPSSGQLILYVKGSDATVLPRCSFKGQAEEAIAKS